MTFTAEDAVRSGALTDTNAFNAVCDDLARMQEEVERLRAIETAAIAVRASACVDMGDGQWVAGDDELGALFALLPDPKPGF